MIFSDAISSISKTCFEPAALVTPNGGEPLSACNTTTRAASVVYWDTRERGARSSRSLFVAVLKVVAMIGQRSTRRILGGVDLDLIVGLVFRHDQLTEMVGCLRSRGKGDFVVLGVTEARTHFCRLFSNAL